MAGNSLSQTSLTGHVRQDQHGLQIQVQITIIPVRQVRKKKQRIFKMLLLVFCFVLFSSNTILTRKLRNMFENKSHLYFVSV